MLADFDGPKENFLALHWVFDNSVPKNAIGKLAKPTVDPRKRCQFRFTNQFGDVKAKLGGERYQAGKRRRREPSHA
jgi:hypothetical protein